MNCYDPEMEISHRYKIEVSPLPPGKGSVKGDPCS